MAAKEDNKSPRLLRGRIAGYTVGLGILTLFVAMITFTIFYIIVFAIEELVAGIRAVVSSIHRKTRLGT